jgi:hypothetical protein
LHAVEEGRRGLSGVEFRFACRWGIDLADAGARAANVGRVIHND